MIHFGGLDVPLKDLRYALRIFARSPGFTAVAILSLALGIGANTAIFSVMDALLLKMLPVKNPEQLVRTRGQLSYPAFQKISSHNDVFSGMFVDSYVYQASVRITEEGEQSNALMVSGNYCSVLGIQPAAGRCLTPEDDSVPGVGGPQGAVGMISYQYWQRRFVLDPGVLGKSIALNGSPIIIVGVTPPHFFGLDQTMSPDVTVPIMLQPRIDNRANTELWMHGDEGSTLSYDLTDRYGPPFVARLKPGVTITQAQAEINVLYQQILAARAGNNTDQRKRRENAEKKIELVEAGNGYESWEPEDRSLLLITMIGVPALVLLIACANVANLLLARAAARQNEVAVRIAVGAGRFRLVRQFLTESFLLALAGGLLGLVFASWGRRIMLAWITWLVSDFPFYTRAETDFRVLAYTAGTSLFAVILFGLAPALRASRTELAPLLKEGGRGLSAGRGWETGKVLVGAQVALSLLLLIGAGLLVRSVQNLRSFDSGYSRKDLYVAYVSFSGYKRPRAGTTVRQIWDHVATLPGAQAVAVTSNLPPWGRRFNISVEGSKSASEKEQMYADRFLIGPGFFKTLGIPLLSGRVIDARDDENTPKVCVVTTEFARVIFPGEDPIGRHFTFQRAGAEYAAEIVGVVKDINKADAKEKVWRAAFCPTLQDLPIDGALVLIRAAGNPSVAISELRQQFRMIDQNLFLDVKSLQSFSDGDLFLQRLAAGLSTAFALLALLLASVGLYGVMAYSVSRRTNELGIRMAIGAERSNIVGMVVRETMRLVGIGMAVGLAVAIVATRLVAASLFGVKPTDPLTICIAVVVMASVALLAAYVPARRAASVDPMIALRHE
jgi:predicted permease